MSQPADLDFIVREGSDFGRAIANIRRAQGMTQAEFATRSGLSRTYLSQIEAGRTNPLLELMLAILRRSGAEVSVRWRRDG